ncbi:MAG: sensor histidine kinase [Anaerolineales bacterium]|jgi:signal transduction histidine kinase
MLRTLRNRLILSHLLPLLILIPLLGIAIIYILETRVILPSLSDELVTEAGLIAELAGDQPGMWQDQESLELLIDRLSQKTNARLMLIDPSGVLIGSSDPSDVSRVGTILSDDDIAKVQKGFLTHDIDYSKGLEAQVIDVFAPVFTSGDQLVGIIRMSYPYMTIYDNLLQIRFLILLVVLFALLVGIGLGSFLAVTINKPIQQVTTAIGELAHGNKLEKLKLSGPEEIQSLARSTNVLFDRLLSLERTRKQLLANLVHEIGRPLGALRSAIESLTQGAEKDPLLFNDLKKGMDAQTARLQFLLNDLAHLHDQAFGSLELDRQKISQPEWLLTILRPWEEAAHKKNLEWRVDISENLRDFEGDPQRLAQAIENLVSNAIKYTPTGGLITVSAGADRTIFWVTVSDTGPGIPEDEKEKIFIPFYRGDQKRRIKQGMGLGLSIAHDVALAHGGEINLDSTVGIGSSFTIWIPLI